MSFDDLGYDDDILGELLEGDDELGAIVRRRKAAGKKPVKNVSRSTVAKAFAGRAAGAPGVRDYVMPFPATSLTASVTVATQTAQPQRRFIGRRLVIALGRNGASATGMVTITSLLVGVESQFASAGSVPADAFGATAVGTMLELDASSPGVTITLTLAVSPAPTTTDTITVASCLIGPSMA